jgi:hypothetical protein
MSDEQALNIYNHFLTNSVRANADSQRTASLIARYAADSALCAGASPLNKFGRRVFSQNEEDGITFEILRRIGGLHGGTFAEFGVGNGFENNTLALVALGWSGFWSGNQDLAFNINPRGVSDCKFTYQKSWIKKDNIFDIYQTGLRSIRQETCSVISLDLDGNDYYFIRELLERGASPDLFIAEYNAKFIPPISFVIDYDESHSWTGDDYFGVSLAVLVDLFKSHGYFLACCNITGANAFFVKNVYHDNFRDVPTDVSLIYRSPKYFLTGFDFSGHPQSAKTIESLVSRVNC